MARYNPFHKFRKYQKQAMAALCGVAMISFVFMGITPTCMNYRQNSGADVIAKCRLYGDVSTQHLYSLQDHRRVLSQFYQLLLRNLAADGKATPGPDGILIHTATGESLRALQEEASYFAAQMPDEVLIQNWLLTNYSKDQGAVMSEESVQKYLIDLTSRTMTNDVFIQTLKDMNLTEKVIIHLLQEELYAKQVRDLQTVEMRIVPPLTRWDWYQRMFRSVAAEVAVLPVESFIGQVKDPATSDLKRFYDLHKDTVYDPALPDSGFAIPRKVGFQAVSVIPSQEGIDSITAEEIATYYEENKERMFRKTNITEPRATSPLDRAPGVGSALQNQLFPMPGTTSGAGTIPGFDSDFLRGLQGSGLGTGGGGTGLGPIPGLTRTPGLPTPIIPILPPAENPTPVTEETPAEGEKPAETPPPVTEETPAKEEKPAEDQTNVARPVFHHVVYRHEDEPAAESVPVLEETAIVDQSDNPSLTIGALAVEEPAPAVDLRGLYRPLSEVEPLIRQFLAIQKTREGMAAVEKEMQAFFGKFVKHEADAKKYPMPAPLDLEGLAKKYGLTYVTSPPVSVFEARRMTLGQWGEGGQFISQAFTGSAMLYKPIPIASQMYGYMNQSTEIVGWVTAIESRRIPTFDEAKETVRQRYKEIEARKIAKEKAEELAKLARSSADKSLREIAAGNNDIHVVETELFTWKRSNYSSMNMYRRSDVVTGEVREKIAAAADGIADGITENRWIHAPGESFMETAYGLAPQQSGVAMNQPETDAYVIRLTESTPDGDILVKSFQTASFGTYAMAGYVDMMTSLRNSQMEAVEKHAGFQWVNKPLDRMEMREE